MLVVDASMILSLILDDESHLSGVAIAEAIEECETIAPALIWYEVRNALITNEKRERHTTDDTAKFLSSVRQLPISLQSPIALSSDRIMELARRHDLSVYDAVYLDLAVERNAELASLDEKLTRAATQEGVDCWSNLTRALQSGSM